MKKEDIVESLARARLGKAMGKMIGLFIDFQEQCEYATIYLQLSFSLENDVKGFRLRTSVVSAKTH